MGEGAHRFDADSEGGLPVFAAVPGVVSENYRLVDVARSFGRTVSSLRALSRRGEFPRLFRLSRNDWRVERRALEAWAESRWSGEARSRVRREAVRDAIRLPARARRAT